MSGKDIVTYELDLAQPEPLTAEQKAELEALAALPDDQIDTSDIPLISEHFFRNAVRGRFYRPVALVAPSKKG
jgi:hypothetical protein